MESARPGYPQPAHVLEHAHVVRVEPPQIRAAQGRAPREQGESQQTDGSERRPRDTIERSGGLTAGGGNGEDEQRQEHGCDPVLGELRAEKHVLRLDDRADGDEERKEREKRSRTRSRPHAPVSREAREPGKTDPDPDSRRTIEGGREIQQRDPDDGPDRVVPQSGRPAGVERARALHRDDDRDRRREEEKRGHPDGNALARDPPQAPLRRSPQVSDEPEPGERRGDGHEDVENDELREDPADQERVARSLLSRRNLRGFERAHGTQESGRHESEGEPVPASEAEELQQKGVPVQEDEPREGRPPSRDAREEAPRREEKDRMRDQVREAQRDRDPAEDRLARPREERVEQVVVRGLGTVERQDREWACGDPDVRRDGLVMSARDSCRADRGVGEEQDAERRRSKLGPGRPSHSRYGSYLRIRERRKIRPAMTRVFGDRDRTSGVRPVAAETSATHAAADWFELLAETTFDGVGLTQDEVVVEVNARLASMLGYTRDEIIGAPLMNFVAPVHQNLVRERETAGDEDIYEHRALRKDGSVILVEARGRNCTYRGRPARLAVIRDVTKAALRESLEAGSVLRREKEQLDRAATAGRVALWEWDLATGAIGWTAFVDAMLGYAPGGFPRTVEGWASHVHPEDVDAVVAALDAHLKQNVPYDAAYRIRRADGDYAWWHDVGIAERDAAGKPIRMAGTCVDITEQKKTEEAIRIRDTALKASEHWLEEAQRFARLGWYSFHPGSDVFSVSATVDEMFGVPPAFPHDSASWLSLVHPDDRERARQIMEKSVAGILTPDLMYRIVRPNDGQERYIHAHASAVFDVSGRVVRIFGTIQDETEQRHVESEIRRLAAAVEQVAQSVVITDTGGTIQYVNAAFTAMTGYSREAAIGENPRLLRSGLHDAAHYENLWRTILSGATWRGRFTNRKRDGTLYEADAVITPVRDTFGNLTSFVCLERDITDILTQQMRLQEQQTLAAIGEIAANIAHEVKNPLFAISSGIQLLMEELTLDGEQRRTFEVIHGDVLRMDRLVRQLQLLASRRPLQPGPRAVAGLVEGAATLNRGLAAEKALRVTTEFEEGLPDVFVDEDQIHQVLLNLIQNAISYSPPGGRVSISAVRSSAGDRVILRVHNEGPAIADELAERIFEPFFSTRRESAGMGLAISRRIALDHGGTLRAESHPGAGAVFALELPVRAHP